MKTLTLRHLLGFTVLAAGAYVFLASLPDLKRYIRISTM